MTDRSRSAHENSPGGRLWERVVTAAARALARDGSVGLLETLLEMRLMDPGHVEQWRRGRPGYEAIVGHIQCGAEKLSRVIGWFFEWAEAGALVRVAAEYSRRTPGGVVPLAFTDDRAPAIEAMFRVHFTRADVSEKRRAKVEEKLSKAEDLAVFVSVREAVVCGECGGVIRQGDYLVLEGQQSVCIACADMDHLEFLPAGDTAMTRRARKHSPLVAVVLRFNRSRKRYDRQGLLVTREALARAEAECAADAGERAARREVDTVRRTAVDARHVERLAETIRGLFPHCPPAEAAEIAAHTAERGSGRVGRSAAAKELDADAVTLAVVAHVRHTHTPYDRLLMGGMDRHEARERIRERLAGVLDAWRGTRPEGR